MNWATIAPDTRLYKGKNLFRWEVSPGLEHHCGICATPLHNARAKTSCLGKHVEPCYSCNSSDEMHHNRHKEILKIIREISAIEQASAMLPPGHTFSGSKPRRGSTLTTSTITFTDSSESVCGELSKVTRRERKRAKKASNNSTSKNRRKIEAFPKEELDFVSEALHLSVHESKGAWEGTYVYDHKQPEAKESSPIVDDTDTDMDVDDMAGQSNDLSVKSPSDMTPRQRKTIKKFTSSINHASYGGGSRKFSPLASPRTDAFDGMDPKIFFRLGVEVEYSLKNSKVRKELVAKLVAAVKEDMEIIEREDAETAMREEGFWRWAGKAAYHAILQTRQELDWATGQKKGAPRMELFQEEEVDLEEVDTQAVEEVVQDEAINTPAKVEEDKDEWQQVGKAPLTPAPKQSKVYVKKVAVTKRNVLKKVQPLSDTTNINDSIEEEEGAEDVDEMVKRYSQRLAGKRNLGGSPQTSDKRCGGRLVISVK
ncbi:hypothetical protein N431DRAFT_545555 [Stipitochalara longipes BDJ]|nr:hypothetical protein N431DRAFT_545555 [Stipitochalara longipes BDJ]